MTDTIKRPRNGPSAVRAWIDSRLPQGIVIALTVALGILFFSLVDLEPKVETDFFFSADDPQLQATARIEEEFAHAPQVFISVRAPQLVSRKYLLRLRDLTEDLRRLPGTARVRSITRGPEDPEEIAERDPRKVFKDLRKRPLWSHLLLAPDGTASFIVMGLRGEDHKAAVVAIDSVLAAHQRPDFELAASGVPYAVEHIRVSLSGDLRRFSVAALIAFAIVVAFLFRSLSVVIGTMAAGLCACFATFLLRAALGMRTDILTPNLWTIAFVLTLSHVVYLTAEWRRQVHPVGGGGTDDAVDAARNAVHLTRTASAWSLVANLLGFASLTIASAKPLREFGISGAMAAGFALIAAYVIFPPFLATARPPASGESSIRRRLHGFFTTRHPVIAALLIMTAIALAPFAHRVDTDPSLLTYFADSGRIRTGLETIDRSAGSSPLEVVIIDAQHRPFEDKETFERLMALQHALENHRDVGTVISIALLMAETKRPWYSFLFSWDRRLKETEKPKHGRVGRAFITADHRQGRFILRMNEDTRSRPRADIVRDVEGIVRKHGFEPVLVGGLYLLQGELSELVRASVIRGLGGLLLLFFIIIFIVTRSVPSVLAMTFCLALVPFALFGFVGLLKMPVDIISAPAANVALPLGIDEMIHLGAAMRRRQQTRRDNADPPWRAALADLWAPILASMFIVACGFALFLLSSFPPTHRLGVLVCAGALITDAAVLIILPVLFGLMDRRGGQAGKRPPMAPP